MDLLPARGSHRLLATVLVGLLLLLVLVGLLAVRLLRNADPEPEDTVTETVAAESSASPLRPRQDGPRTEGDAEVVDPGPPFDEARWGSLPDGTKLQRRLALGSLLLRIRSELADGQVDAKAALRLVENRSRKACLDLDACGRAGLEADTEERAASALLAWLLEPRRDPNALTLHAAGESSEPVLGRGATLRVWTSGDPFRASDLAAGEALLDRLRQVAGDRSQDGYDVVATPGMGRELFPQSRLFRFGVPAAGLYASGDDLCLIRTIYPPRFQRVLLKHELVHAWAIRQRGIWPSRFLEEGLAEYLSRHRPADVRLHVPPERFAHEFAALLALVNRQQAYGLRFRSLSFDRLMALEPRDFYALGHVGYLLAQATVAFAGAQVVEEAIRSSAEWPLRSVISPLTWHDLVTFLEVYARGGRTGQAIVIDDLGPGSDVDIEGLRWRVGRMQPRRVLRAIGITVPDGLDESALAGVLRLPSRVSAQDTARIHHVLEGLLTDSGGDLLLVSDATPALREPFRWSTQTTRALSRLVSEPKTLGSRAAFVEQLAVGLERARGGRRPVLLAWGGALEEGTFPLPVLDGPVSAWRLLIGLDARDNQEPSLVVCCASWDRDRGLMRSRLAEIRGVPEAEVSEAEVGDALRQILAHSLNRMEVRPTRVLVVDLADGASDALLVAGVFADVLGPHAPVALWNPQRPLR